MNDWRARFDTAIGGAFAGVGIGVGLLVVALVVLGLVKLIDLIGAI